jgi:hypothetical protein
MSYPIVAAADAKRYLLALQEDQRQNQEPAAELISRTRDLGDDSDWEQIVVSLEGTLFQLRRELGALQRGGAEGRIFEASASVLVHQILPSRHPALSDPEFWIWLAVSHFRDLITWRYPRADGGVEGANYGIGSAGENFLYRLWLRAELAYDANELDPYRWARVGDVDFWRSHLFRQGYASARQLVRALLKFQFPGREGRPRLSVEQIRELAKQLKRSRTNLIYEVMDEDRAARFVESEWQKLSASRT